MSINDVTAFGGAERLKDFAMTMKKAFKRVTIGREGVRNIKNCVTSFVENPSYIFKQSKTKQHNKLLIPSSCVLPIFSKNITTKLWLV